VTTRLTFGSPTNVFPAWTPDGKRISYVVDEPGGRFSISWKRADGAGDRQILLESDHRPGTMAWRPDGKVLVFTQRNSRQDDADLMWAPLEGDDTTGWKLGKVQTFVGGPNMQTHPAFSPDGKWVAYQSNESGTWEVYVRAFPSVGGRWQISHGGGLYPRWPAKGNEIFYSNGDGGSLVAVPYSASADTFKPGPPRPWSSLAPAALGPLNLNYDITPDGKRAAAIRDYTVSGSEQHLNFVVGFMQDAEKRFGGKSRP
jgi:eukaryotic-like serine/threonine-protein kinase